MFHYIIALSTFEQQVHMLIKSVGELLKLLLSQEKLKMAGYTDAIFITEKSVLYYYRSRGDASHYLSLFYGTLSFSTESIEQSK